MHKDVKKAAASKTTAFSNCSKAMPSWKLKPVSM